MKKEPSYLALYRSGELQKRADEAMRLFENCGACPHNCSKNRLAGEKGICGSLSNPVVSSYTLHHGEEPLISGTRGAGNIFFGSCNLRCIFCQNYEISQSKEEEKLHTVSVERLAEIMLELQSMGAHNIGLVSPTHFAPVILKALAIAAGGGLSLPVIYNSNGYDSVKMLKLLEGVVDIYLPDLKYGCDGYGEKYSNAEGYFTAAKEAVKEMYHQVGSGIQVEEGVITQGLIIRHLVLPNGLAESGEVFKFIAGELDKEVHISLMSQYYPVHNAFREILLSRKLRESEYEKAVRLMEKYGLTNGWMQEMESYENYRPEFNRNRNNPFGN